MQMTFVFIFYIAFNLVPGKVDQFQIEAQHPEKENERLTLFFAREAKEWKITTNTGKKESAFLRFEGSTFYMREGEGDGKKPQKIDLLSKMAVVTDHKKWRKVTKVTFKGKEDKGNNPKGKSLTFHVVKKGKKKRTIKLDRTNNPGLGEGIPIMHINWK